MGPPGPAPNFGGGWVIMPFRRPLRGTPSGKILRKSDERLSRKSTLNFFLRNPLDAQKERIRTRYDSDVKSSTLSVIGLAPRRRWRGPARAATLPARGDRFGRRYGNQKPYFRFYRTGSSITRTDFGAWTDRRSIIGDRAATQAEIRRKPSSRGRWRPNRK